MSERRRTHARGLTMPPGRRIPRPPPTPPKRPPLPDPSGTELPADAAKASGELVALAALIRACEACGRAGPARVLGTGYPRAPVMLVKDIPSPEDVESGNAFTAEAEALTKAFDALGIPLGWIYGSTAVRCGPGAASEQEVGACSVHLLTEIEAVLPRVLVAFGPAAVEAVRALEGRCGISVPDDVPQGTPVPIRADLVLLATESLPDGITGREAKRRLWRDLQAVPKLIS
jgi:uracil-DNA glycosylase family 4